MNRNVFGNVQIDLDRLSQYAYLRKYLRPALVLVVHVKSMETYELTADPKGTLILTTDSDFLKYLKKSP